MRKMGKKVLPTLLAVSMVCGSVSPAFAADLFSADEAVEFTSENINVATEPGPGPGEVVPNFIIVYKCDGIEVGRKTVEYMVARDGIDFSEVPELENYTVLPFDGVKYRNNKDEVEVEVEEVVKTQFVKVFFLNDGKPVGESVKVEIDEAATGVDVSTLEAPAGFIIVGSGVEAIQPDGNVYVNVVPATKKVKIIFMLNDGTIVDDTTEVEVEAGATEYKVNAETVTIPENYNLVSEGITPIAEDGKIYVSVAPKTEKVKVVFILNDGTIVDETTEVEVEAGTTEYKVNAETVTVPKNFNLVSEGITSITDGKIYVQVAPKTEKIKVVFMLSNGIVVDETTEVEVEAGTTEYKVNAETVTVPKNFNLVSEGITSITDGKIYVQVAPKTEKIKVVFMLSNGIVVDETTEVEVEAGTTEYKVNAETVTVPKNFNLVSEGITSITDGKIYVQVAPKTEKVKVIFMLNDGTIVNKNTEVEVKAGTTEYKVNTKTVKVPKNFNLVSEGITPITDGKIYVQVAQKTKKVTIVYRTSDRKVVDREVVKVSVDAKKVKLSDLTAPKGYTIISTKDASINDNIAYVTVKRTTKKVNIVFKTKDGKTVETRPMEVNATTKYINVNDLKAKDGYTIISTGRAYFDENGNAIVWVKRATKDVKVVFRTKAGRIIESRDMEVSLTTKYIKLNGLKAPKGYYIVKNKSIASINEKGTAYVTVDRVRK